MSRSPYQGVAGAKLQNFDGFSKRIHHPYKLGESPPPTDLLGYFGKLILDDLAVI